MHVCKVYALEVLHLSDSIAVSDQQTDRPSAFNDWKLICGVVGLCVVGLCVTSFWLLLVRARCIAMVQLWMAECWCCFVDYFALWSLYKWVCDRTSRSERDREAKCTTARPYLNVEQLNLPSSRDHQHTHIHMEWMWCGATWRIPCVWFYHSTSARCKMWFMLFFKHVCYN